MSNHPGVAEESYDRTHRSMLPAVFQVMHLGPYPQMGIFGLSGHLPNKNPHLGVYGHWERNCSLQCAACAGVTAAPFHSRRAVRAAKIKLIINCMHQATRGGANKQLNVCSVYEYGQILERNGRFLLSGQ